MFENDRDQSTRQHPVMVGLARGDQHGGPTAMTNVLAESLAECGGLDIGSLTTRYLRWWQNEGFDTGPIFNGVMAFIEEGVDREKAVSQADENHRGLTAGCNPAHRIAPLSLIASISIEQLPDLAIQEAKISHLHPLAGDVSAAVVVLCRALIEGESYVSAKKLAASDRLPETVEALLCPEDQPLDTSGYSPEALRAAIHFIDRSSSADEALNEAGIFAGVSNYCPVLVGAISGARW